MGFILVSMIAVCGIAFLILHLVAADIERIPFDIQVVMVHTYHPKNSQVPDRGRLIVAEAVRLAKRHHCSLILCAGHTIPGDSRTEAEIYRDYIDAHYTDITVMLGEDREVRNTYGEVGEAAKIIERMGYTKIAVVGFRPHLPRIWYLWKRRNPLLVPKITFVGVSGAWPWQYIWEALMFLLELAFPAGSPRRDRIFHTLTGRRKFAPKK